MVVDEDEHGISEDRCEWLRLLRPVPDRSNTCSILTKVDESTNIHETECEHSHERREDLKVLGVLDITEAEDAAEHLED